MAAGRRPALGAVGEARLLAHLARALAQRAARPADLAIGDDAALLALSATAHDRVVASCDALVEDVDFRRAWSTPSDVGLKAAAANLSDLAAMGAAPRGLLAAVAAPPELGAAALLRLLLALDAGGRRHGAPLVGGDLSATRGPLVVAVTALGAVPASEALRRHAARPGDLVAVTGELGGAARGLTALADGTADTDAARPHVRRQLRPRPQVALGRRLAALRLVAAAADISDGLAKDVLHLVPPTHGVRLDLARLPLARPLARDAATGVAAALYGGEDYELVLAIAPAKLAAATAAATAERQALTVIGRITAAPGLSFSGVPPPGRAYDHFGGAR